MGGLEEKQENINLRQDKVEGKMLEQSREIGTAMCKFRKKVWNREGKMIRWEDHKQDREKGNSEWVEQLRQITNKNLREIGGNYLTKYIESIEKEESLKRKLRL